MANTQARGTQVLNNSIYAVDINLSDAVGLYANITNNTKFAVYDGDEPGATKTKTISISVLDTYNAAKYAPLSVYPATGLTTGYIPYKSASVLANSPIYTNGTKVGIRMTNPVYPLDIEGTIHFGQASNGYAMLQSGGWGTEIGFTDDNGNAIAVKYADSGKYQFGGSLGSSDGIIVYNGNVGIGTTNPGAKLEVASGTAKFLFEPSTASISAPNSTDIRLQANSQNIFRGLDDWTGTWSDAVTTTYFQTGRSSGNTAFSSFGGNPYNRLAFISSKTQFVNNGGAVTPPVNYFQVDYNNNNLFSIQTGGNVGIGTTNPSELLSLGTAGTKAGTLSLAGLTSGKAIINVLAVAGTPTLTLPTTTGTLALLSNIPSLTGYALLSGATFSGTISATNLSGTNTGDNAVNSLYSGLVSNATHTGDVTGSTALTLATVNSNVGTFNNVTVNAKGLVTAASNVTYLTSLGTAIIDADFASNGIMVRTAAGVYGIIPDNSSTWNALTSFPGFGLTTGKVWGYDSHPTTIAGYGITDIPTYQAPLNGTGFVKASGTTISYDNSTYEPSFSKNTGFNKNFGTTTGTVLEGRTFGTAANSASTDFAPSSTVSFPGFGTTHVLAAYGDHTHSQYENYLSTPSVSGYILASTASGVRSWVSPSNHTHNYQAPITTGTTSQYFRGDLSLATFPTIPTTTSELTNNSGFITGTGTAGRIAFWNGSNSLSSESYLTWNTINSTLSTFGFSCDNIETSLIIATDIVSTSGFQFGTSTTAGYVLTTDSFGNGSWQAPSSSYSLPTASSTTLGGVKIGSGINITSGVISVQTYSGTNFILNQSASAQSANIWISGYLRTNTDIILTNNDTYIAGYNTSGNILRIIGINSANKIIVDQGAYGVVFGGGISASAFKLGTSTTAGYVLKTDAYGNGSWQANTISGVILANGTVGLTANWNAGGDSYAITAENFILGSDRRFKTNIAPISFNYLDIDYKEFEMKSKLGEKRYGVIAQDLLKIAPELIVSNEDGYYSVKYIDLLIHEIAYLKNEIKLLKNGSTR